MGFEGFYFGFFFGGGAVCPWICKFGVVFAKLSGSRCCWGSDAVALGVHTEVWGMLKSLWFSGCGSHQWKHSNNPLGAQKRPFLTGTTWNLFAPKPLRSFRAAASKAAEPQRSPNSPKISPTVGTFLPKELWFFWFKAALPPLGTSKSPAPIPVLPAPHYKLENKTKYHHKYDNFIKIYLWVQINDYMDKVHCL